MVYMGLENNIHNAKINHLYSNHIIEYEYYIDDLLYNIPANI